MFRPEDLLQMVSTAVAPAAARRITRRTAAGAEANKTAARERYRRMSPEDRASYNQRITDRRRARAQEQGTA
jgi:hypothetical protein